MRKALLALPIAAALTAAAIVAPGRIEARMNTILPRAAYRPGGRAWALHARLTIADLHADSLLWDRDLLKRASRGHVDVPRLIEGNVALQAFTVVTKTPRRTNIHRNDDRSDEITPLAILQRWPPRTWTSLKERALYQAARLEDTARRSRGRLVRITSRAELAAYLERRRREPAITAGFLGLEGGHALEGDVANVDVLFQAGFRMMALTHFFDNDLAGSAHGVAQGGLTAKGRDVVRALEVLGVLVDLAHASSRTIDDVLGMTTRPLVVSHTGVRGTCDNARNLDDGRLARIAATGGLIGISFFPTAVCGRDGRAVARAVRHAASVAGIEHVALGSDFDGAVAVPFDAAGLVEVTDALLAEGFSDAEVEAVMGGNVFRLLGRTLP